MQNGSLPDVVRPNKNSRVTQLNFKIPYAAEIFNVNASDAH
jgi:hypothetical protein